MASNSTLETRFTANIVQFENELKRLQRLNTQAANKIAADQAKAAKQVETAWANSNIGQAMTKSMASLGDAVKGYAVILAGAFAGKEALEAADAWKRFGNSLAVAGVSANAMHGVQEQLYQIAIKNGTAIEPLGALYSRLSLAQKSIGATAPQMIQFTGGVAAALKVAGVSSEEASGALLQLGQLLGSGTVHAQEFTSVLEGARPILQAVAAGNAEAGGSVSKLRNMMIAQKLTSADFFQSFLAGSAMLQEQAAKSATTVGQATTNMKTALTKYIGETDSAYGITDRFVQGIMALANNIGTVAESLAIVGGIYASTFLPALGRASVAIGAQVAATVASIAASVTDTGALIARTAAIYGVSRAQVAATASARALSSAMAFFGGPIGLAITAIAVGLAYLGVESAKSAAAADALTRSIDSQTKSFADQHKASLAARAEHGQLTTAEIRGATAAATMTGEQGKLKDKLYQVAAAAKAAALETATLTQKQADTNFSTAQKAAADKRDSIASHINASRMSPEAVTAAINGALAKTPEFQQYRAARQNRNDANADVAKIGSQKLDEFVVKPEAVEPKAKKTHSIVSRSEDEVGKAQKTLDDAIAKQADTIEERHKAEVILLGQERDEQIRNVEQDIRDKKVRAADGEKAIAIYNETYNTKLATETKKYNRELVDQQNGLLKDNIAAQADDLRAQADKLDDQAKYADWLVDRQRLEQQALNLQQQADDLEYKQSQDQLELDRTRAGVTADVIKSLRAQADANRQYAKNNETKGLGDKQIKEREDGFGKPIGEQIKDKASSFGGINKQLGAIATDGIDKLTSGLTNAIMGAGSLKQAFSEMAKSIIADLIQMAVKFVIFQAIGMALGIPGLGKAAIGLGNLPAHASGTDFAPGGLSMVGEKGPELMFVPHGSQIVPNNLLRSAMNGAGASGNARGNAGITIATTINAQDAVLTGEVKRWIYESQAQSIQQAEKMTMRNFSKRQTNTLYR